MFDSNIKITSDFSKHLTSYFTSFLCHEGDPEEWKMGALWTNWNKQKATKNKRFCLNVFKDTFFFIVL